MPGTVLVVGGMVKPERGCRAQGVPRREWEKEQQRELGCRKEKKALEGGGRDWGAGLWGVDPR